MFYIVKASYVDPAYTSKKCAIGADTSETGMENHPSVLLVGTTDHADSNGRFNIAKHPFIDRSTKERDLVEGTTDSRDFLPALKSGASCFTDSTLT